MNSYFDHEDEREAIEQAKKFEDQKLMQDAQAINDSRAKELFDDAHGGGFITIPTEQYQKQLRDYLQSKIRLNEAKQPFTIPDENIPPEYQIHLGAAAWNGARVVFHRDILAQPCVVMGAAGVGKSNLSRYVSSQVGLTNKPVHYFDAKGDVPSLLNKYPGKTLVLKPSEEYVNLLEGTGDSFLQHMVFADSLGKMLSLPSLTRMRLFKILRRIQKGISKGIPPASIQDVREVILRLRFDNNEEDKESLRTISQAIDLLIALAPYAGRVRKPPTIEDYFSIIIHSRFSIPEPFDRLLLDLFFVYLLQEASVLGHTLSLRRLLVFEEGLTNFSKDVNPEGLGRLSTAKRMVSQLRSTGNGLMINLQSLSLADDLVLANANLLICFRCPQVEDSLIAASMLGLKPEDAAFIRILPKWHAFVRWDGCPHGILLKIPYFDLGICPTEAEIQRRMVGPFKLLDDITQRASFRPERATPIYYLPFIGDHSDESFLQTPPESSPSAAEDTSSEPTNLQDQFIAFLIEIRDHPERSFTEHYKALKWSAKTAQAVRKALEEDGKIKVDKIKQGGVGAPVMRITITQDGLNFINGPK